MLVRQADGSEARLWVAARPILDDDNQVRGAVASMADITDLKKINAPCKRRPSGSINGYRSGPESCRRAKRPSAPQPPRSKGLTNACSSCTRRLLQVQENERREIARELHDEAGQLLTALKVGLKLLQPRAAA